METRGKKRRGRPPLPRDEKRVRVVGFLHPADLATLERIAAQRGVTSGKAAGELLERALARRRG